MEKITDLNQINTATLEGQYLMSALALITQALLTKDTPHDVLGELSTHVARMKEEYSRDIQIQDAMRRLNHELKHDPGYFYAWQSNIAMAFKDEYDRRAKNGGAVEIHDVANTAATNFLDFLSKPTNGDT